MLELCDVIVESYNQILAIVNYICFAAVIICCVYIYCVLVIGQVERFYKHLAISALIILIVLVIIHFVMLDSFGIPLIVPPVNTLYFTEFMHVMQYIASVAIIILCAIIFLTAVLSKIDHFYGRTFMSAFLCLIVLLVIHFYIEDMFGIRLIFPPNLW